MNAIEYENVPCNICGSFDKEKRMFPVRSGHLVRCRMCDLYYANPRRTDIINKHSRGEVAELFSAKMLNSRGRKLEFNGYLDDLEELKPQKGLILDIGCFEGLLLDQAKKRGWACAGVEPNRGASDYANTEYKVNVKAGTLEQADFEKDAFDVVSMAAILEHHSNPLSLLMQVRTLLKADGVILVSVPVIPIYIGIIRSRWRMFIGGHNYFFTDKSMQLLLNRSGFEMISSRFVPKSVDLETIADRLSNEEQPSNIGRCGRLVSQAVRKLRLGRVRIAVNMFDSKVYYAKKRI